MKPLLVVLTVLMLSLPILSQAQQYYSQEMPCYACPPAPCPTDLEMRVDTMGARMGNRFAHGVHMAVTSPKHITRSFFNGDPAVEIPVLSNIAGAVLGPLRTVRDATVGVFEVATFPLIFFGTNERNGGPLYQDCYYLPSLAYRAEDEGF